MFGFFKKKKKKKTVKKIERRRGERRKNTEPRRQEVRWEPEKPDRRSGNDRRKDGNTWDQDR